MRIAECDFQIEDWDSSDLGFGISDWGLKKTISNFHILAFCLKDRKDGK